MAAELQKLAPPKRAWWFEVQRDEGDAWQPVEVDGRTWFRVDGSPTPEQIAAADAAELGAVASYRVEWRQKKRELRKLGYSVPFKMDPPNGAEAAEAADDDEDEDDEEIEDEDTGDTEPPPPPAPKPKRRVNGHNNGHKNGHAHMAQIVGAPRPPAAYSADPNMFPFQAFSYLKETERLDAEHRERERDRRDQREREFQAQMMAYITTSAKENSATMQAFFQRMMDLQRETSEHATRAAVAEATADDGGVSDELVEQLAAIKVELAGLKEHEGVVVNADGEQIDMNAVWSVLTGAARVIGQTQWAQKNLPELAKMFVGGAIP